MPAPLNNTHYRALALLRRCALVRINGAWRWGTTEVGDSVIDLLKQHGHVSHFYPGSPSECIILRGKMPLTGAT